MARPLTVVRAIPFVALLAVVALSACKRGPKEVKASCDMRSGAGSSSSAICIDFHVEPNAKAAGICAGSGTMAQKPCDRASSLGGCEKGNLTNWYYTSSRHATAADVMKECPGKYLPPSTPIGAQ